MKATPLPENPTLTDLAARLGEMHECLDAVSARQSTAMAELTQIVRDDRHFARDRAMVVEARFTKIDKRLETIEATQVDAHAGILGVAGQLKGLADDKLVVDAAHDQRINQLAQTVTKVAVRVGVGRKTASMMMTLTPWKLMLGVGAVGGFVGALQLLVKLTPPLLKMLGS